MREAVIVSTARTPIGKAYRGAFNDTESPSMAAPVIQEAIKRARVEPAEIDDLIMGAALQQGTQGFKRRTSMRRRRGAADQRSGPDRRSAVLFRLD